jgi:hypothetical protein
MKMVRPKILYRYMDSTSSSDGKKIEKHRITNECAPQVELEKVLNCYAAIPQYCVLWRCRCSSGDHYGYATLQEAKLEEIENCKNRISDDQKWLKKLLGEGK